MRLNVENTRNEARFLRADVPRSYWQQHPPRRKRQPANDHHGRRWPASAGGAGADTGGDSSDDYAGNIYHTVTLLWPRVQADEASHRGQKSTQD